MKLKRIVAVLFCLALASPAVADIVVKSGATSDTLTVDTNKNARVSHGVSTRPTYNVSVSGAGAAAAHTLSIESGSGTGFKLTKWCVTVSNATAASSIAVVVQRRTTAASSGGTQLGSEGTTANNISKFNPSDGNYPGIARIDGTPGTAGSILDQHQIQIGIIATGAGSSTPYCVTYDGLAGEYPTAQAGVTNGISITLPTLGAGSLAVGITATVIAE